MLIPRTHFLKILTPFLGSMHIATLIFTRNIIKSVKIEFSLRLNKHTLILTLTYSHSYNHTHILTLTYSHPHTYTHSLTIIPKYSTSNLYSQTQIFKLIYSHSHAHTDILTYTNCHSCNNFHILIFTYSPSHTETRLIYNGVSTN